MRHGRFYEDFTVGTVIEHWPGRTVGESDHRLFCLLTLNTTHDGPLVHVGYLYSLLLGLSLADISVNAIYHHESKIAEIAPVREGETIYCRSEVLSKDALPGKTDRGLVTFETRGYTEQEKLFMSFRRQIAVRRW